MFDNFSIADECEKYYVGNQSSEDTSEAVVVTAVKDGNNLIPAKVVIDELEATRLAARASAELARVKALNIITPADYDAAVAIAKGTKETRKVIEEFFEPVKKEASKILDDIRSRAKAVCNPLDEAEKVIKCKMLAYQQEQRRKAEEAEKAAAEARKKAADDLLAQAVEAEESGDSLTAQIMTEAAASAESGKIGSVVVSAPKVQGVQVRKTWKAKIVDDAAVPVTFAGMCLRPVDMPTLNKLASTSKGTMQVPGVVFYQDEGIALR